MGAGSKIQLIGTPGVKDSETEVTGRALHVKVVDGIFIQEHTLAGEDQTGVGVSALFLLKDGIVVQQCPVLCSKTMRLQRIGLVLVVPVGVPGLIVTIGIQKHTQCGPNVLVGGVLFSMPNNGRNCGVELITPEPQFDPGDAWFMQCTFSAPVTNPRMRVSSFWSF